MRMQNAKMSSMYVQHDPVDVDCSVEPSRTRQEFADECDINNILRGYEKTGVISHIDPREPVYLDTTDVVDLQSAIEIVRVAEAAFMSLPAAVRREFDNDAVKWADFASDPANVEKMREWGLAEPLAPEPAIVKVEVTNPATPAP